MGLPSTAFTFVVLASLRNRRLEVVGKRENGRARGRHARGEGAPSPLACLLLARSFSLACAHYFQAPAATQAAFWHSNASTEDRSDQEPIKWLSWSDRLLIASSRFELLRMYSAEVRWPILRILLCLAHALNIPGCDLCQKEKLSRWAYFITGLCHRQPS